MLMLVSVLVLGCTGLVSCASTGHTIVQDYFTLNNTLQIVPSPSTGYKSGRGFMRHKNSGKNIDPEGLACPRNDHRLMIGPSGNNEDMMYRFVQVEGHLGYLEHHCGDTVAHPYRGGTDPGDETDLEMTTGRDAGCLFYFDEYAGRIVHRGGKFIWIVNNLSPPTHGGGVLLKVSKNQNDASSFYWVGEDGSDSAYPAPALNGRWVMIFSVINPINEHTYTIRHKIGKSITRQSTEIVSWKVSLNGAFKWFQGSSEYSYLACISETITWDFEVEREYSVTVYPGQTSVTWQWVFEAERFGEQMTFRSNIRGDTNDLYTPPEMPTPGMYPNNC